MLTKSRQRLMKSSRGAEGLGDRAVKDYGDTCRDHEGVADTLLQVVLAVWASKPLVDNFWVWVSKPELKIWLECEEARGVIMKLAPR